VRFRVHDGNPQGDLVDLLLQLNCKYTCGVLCVNDFLCRFRQDGWRGPALSTSSSYPKRDRQDQHEQDGVDVAGDAVVFVGERLPFVLHEHGVGHTLDKAGENGER